MVVTTCPFYWVRCRIHTHPVIWPAPTEAPPVKGAAARQPVVVRVPASSYSTTITSGSAVS